MSQEYKTVSINTPSVCLKSFAEQCEARGRFSIGRPNDYDWRGPVAFQCDGMLHGVADMIDCVEVAHGKPPHWLWIMADFQNFAAPVPVTSNRDYLALRRAAWPEESAEDSIASCEAPGVEAESPNNATYPEVECAGESQPATQPAAPRRRRQSPSPDQLGLFG